MGDRANIYLYDSDTAGIYVYTHWNGSEWPQRLAEALEFGKERWSDPQYLARIIVTQVFKDLKGTTGGGVSTRIGDNGHPILCVDLMGEQVAIAKEGDEQDRDKWTGFMSFREFTTTFADQGWDAFR